MPRGHSQNPHKYGVFSTVVITVSLTSSAAAAFKRSQSKHRERRHVSRRVPRRPPPPVTVGGWICRTLAAVLLQWVPVERPPPPSLSGRRGMPAEATPRTWSMAFR